MTIRDMILHLRVNKIVLPACVVSTTSNFLQQPSETEQLAKGMTKVEYMYIYQLARSCPSLDSAWQTPGVSEQALNSHTSCQLLTSKDEIVRLSITF